MKPRIWKVTMWMSEKRNWTTEYELAEFTWSNYKGGTINAEYSHGDYHFDCLGAFPVCDMVKLERIMD